MKRCPQREVPLYIILISWHRTWPTHIFMLADDWMGKLNPAPFCVCSGVAVLYMYFWLCEHCTVHPQEILWIFWHHYTRIYSNAGTCTSHGMPQTNYSIMWTFTFCVDELAYSHTLLWGQVTGIDMWPMLEGAVLCRTINDIIWSRTKNILWQNGYELHG